MSEELRKAAHDAAMKLCTQIEKQTLQIAPRFGVHVWDRKSNNRIALGYQQYLVSIQKTPKKGGKS
ncbi:hypothetical protein [uncultured Brevibacillus sp.]|uniref:hypothetical protein n=1 Tax=uncultured Brevibacillus sp. TaxID=169970 RepID=UPI0025989A70|nr:hypothetical protein [uncultured Brevibacillus sp.]